MENLIETLQRWYPLLFILSAVIALTVRILASRKKARHDFRQAAELVLNRQYRNGNISKAELDSRLHSLLKNKHYE